MGYRELHRMEIEEVVRRWQVGESQRAIARAGERYPAGPKTGGLVDRARVLENSQQLGVRGSRGHAWMTLSGNPQVCS